MKIVHLTDYYQPWMGYQDTYLCQEQAKMGHEVWVVTSDRFAPSTQKVKTNRFVEPGFTKENGVNVRRLPLYFELTTTNGYVCMKGLKEALESIGPDIIHCHGIISLTSLMAASYKKRIHYGLVYDNHTSLLNLYNLGEGHLKKFIKTAVYKLFSVFIKAFVLPKADRVVPIGEEEKEFLFWLFGEKANKYPIIHLGADHRLFFPDYDARAQYRKIYQWEPEDLILGHAGKLQPSKGIENLIRALPSLLNDRMRVRILLIGSIDADYKKYLEEIINDLCIENSVYFHPFASKEELPRLLNTFDIAVWPGDITNTAIEAMAIGLPIIACRSLYTEAIIEKYSAGTLISRNNIRDLALATESLINDSEKRKSIGENARKAVETELNWESISNQFIELYQAILDQKKIGHRD
jgi:glycosyltransferase involved in cell wall biosynthesis